MREGKFFVPDFDQMYGQVNGYDAEDPSVSPANVKAFVESIFDYEQLEYQGATRNWVAFWNYIHHSEEFWWNYFTGMSVNSTSRVRGKASGDAYLEWYRSGDRKAVDEEVSES